MHPIGKGQTTTDKLMLLTNPMKVQTISKPHALVALSLHIPVIDTSNDKNSKIREIAH